MYHKIVVPLDGSKIAEGVLDHALGMAKAHGASLALLRAIDLRTAVPGGYVLADGPAQALRRSLALDARRYLDGVASGVRQRGAAVETGVVFGPVAESIVQWAQDNGGDLIALMSHGLGRSARWVFGSVADRLLQSSPVPILVVRASKEVLDAQEEYEEAQMDAKLLETLQAN